MKISRKIWLDTHPLTTELETAGDTLRALWEKVAPAVKAKPAPRSDQTFDVRQVARRLGITDDQVRGFVRDGAAATSVFSPLDVRTFGMATAADRFNSAAPIHKRLP